MDKICISSQIKTKIRKNTIAWLFLGSNLISSFIVCSIKNHYYLHLDCDLKYFFLISKLCKSKTFRNSEQNEIFCWVFKRVKTLRCDDVLLLFPSRTRSENEKSRQQKCQNCVKTFLTSNVVLKNIVFHSKTTKRIT